MSYDNDFRIAVATFDSFKSARSALFDLRCAGFREDEIGFAARDIDRTVDRETAANDVAADATLAGAAMGAGAGGLWGIGIVAGLLPAIGPVFAGGIFTALLASAASGAAAGGLVGTLIDLGLSGEDATHYEEDFNQGKTVMTVRSENRYNEAIEILERNGGLVSLRSNLTP